MTRFALRYPYLIVVICLITCVVGVASLVRMPVDLFPPIHIPVVVVATFFNGMPPEQIENDITGRFERFFTLAAGIDHIESRSLPGVSLIKVFFQPGMEADNAVSVIANLASANLRRLPPGTLPPVVLKFDASSLPVCLITLKGAGLTEAALRDQAQYTVRNQVANVPGASVPQPFGGKYRQIMVYVDPLKLEANQLSVMDVVRSVNDSNLILPAGDVRIGPVDYNIYANSQLEALDDINRLPLKTVHGNSVLVADVGAAKDAAQIQNNIVRVDGQPSVYLPVLKQGGDANTLAVVDGVRDAVAHLLDTPKALVTRVVFDQSVFVRNAIENLLHEGAIGLVLTGLMILLFLGSTRATVAVFLSIPLSALAAFIALGLGGATVNSMVLGGLALAFSRLIDNSVVVLENIFRHLERGETPAVAAEKGGQEVALPVLAATLTTAVVFFPVTFLYGVSRFLFSALAISVVLSLFASYFVALTVVPLFCARFIKGAGHGASAAGGALSPGGRVTEMFNKRFNRLLGSYDRGLTQALARPIAIVAGLIGLSILSLGLFHWVGVSYFPKTDPGQFVINLKAVPGTRIEETEKLVARVEGIIRGEIPTNELAIVVSNIGVQPGFSSIYTSNSGQHTAFVQASLKAGHATSTFALMERVRRRLRAETPELDAYFQTGGLVDAVLNLGLPAPIDIQISGSNLEKAHATAVEIARRVRALPGVSDVLVPQDVDYPALQLNVDRARAAELGMTSKEVVQNVITALASDQMIAPSYWVDPKSGNDYLLTVQYTEGSVKSIEDLEAIPIRSPQAPLSTRLDNLTTVKLIHAPTEVDHYQLRRVTDVYVSPSGEDLGALAARIDRAIQEAKPPADVRITLRGMVQGMRSSFRSFGLGLALAVVLVYLILVAQFKSFVDPFLILLAVPAGVTGVLLTLSLTGTTLNIMSLMGVVMMVGIVVSNSILIVDFTHRLREEGAALHDAIARACRARLRPVLMTSLATLLGLIPMAAKLGAGSEAYAPLARAILGGLAVSVVVTVFLVPVAYLLVYRKREGGNRFQAAAGTALALLACCAARPASLHAAEPPPLTLPEAQQTALENHPKIDAANLAARAAAQVAREARAAFFPAITANVVAVGTGSGNTRLEAAGGLNNSSIFQRNAEGLSVSQLITDFGRTANLAGSAKLRAEASASGAEAARARILLQVDEAFYAALQAQAILGVADQTVATRQLFLDQVTALANNQLRSELDVSFASANLEEARLLASKEQNDLLGELALLSNLMGFSEPRSYRLEEPPMPPDLSTNIYDLTAEALEKRPDLDGLRKDRDASAEFARAEKALRYPTISALGGVGVSPIHDPELPDRYAAAGVVMSLPIYSGGLYTARQREAALRASEAEENLRDGENNAIRDVRIAWLDAQNAFQRLRITGQLVQNARRSLDLAQARYNNGASSIVELNQAQLDAITAEITATSTRYEYLIQRAALSFQAGELR